MNEAKELDHSTLGSGLPASAPPYERYQFKPYTGSSHSWALRVLDTLPSETPVLDVGCGGGAIGKALLSRGYSALDAVEIDAATREQARPFYNRIEETISPFSPATFGAILLLDVVEHMAEPELFLQRVSTLLRPGGTLLLSVPNITHWSVRIPLLFGFFAYTERGILDRTHLQFFTTRRVRDISRSVPGLMLSSYEGSIAPAEFVLPRRISESAWFETLRRVRRTGARIFPGLFAYQHLAVFRKQS